VPFQTYGSAHTLSDNPDGHGSTSHSSSTQLAGRPLLTPDEAMRLPAGQQVLLRSGQRLALVCKLRHYADPEFQGSPD
jgi:type IV secretion system protein VirD4